MDQPRTRKATEQLWPGIADEAEDIAHKPMTHLSTITARPCTVRHAPTTTRIATAPGKIRLLPEEYLCLAANC